MMKKIATQLKHVNLWICLPKIITIVILSLCGCQKKQNNTLVNNAVFKFNLPREVKSLDPLLVRGLNQRYILFNLHRGLYYYNKNNKLTPHGASECVSSKNFLIWTCKLKEFNYHDGNKITAQDYINTLETISDLKEESLESIYNILEFKKESELELHFKLKIPNKKFKHQLANINLVPREDKRIYQKLSDKMSFSGPFKATEHTESDILLNPNPNYLNKKASVSVKAVFVDESTTAISLFETKQIDFLRYLETSFYPKYKDKAFLASNIKLDGIFLSPKIPLELRKKLTHSLRFSDLKRIFSSEGTPGCLQLEGDIFNIKEPLCFKYKKDLNKKVLKKTYKISVPSISQKDHVRLSEWLQSEWKSHLGLNTDIEQIESKIFYQKANAGDLEIYRRSVPLTELHCEHAKKTLLSLPEFKNAKFDLNNSCKEFFKKALSLYYWIPLGIVHIPHLHAEDYKGYYINMLDQFGLEDLERSSL